MNMYRHYERQIGDAIAAGNLGYLNALRIAWQANKRLYPREVVELNMRYAQSAAIMETPLQKARRAMHINQRKGA